MLNRCASFIEFTAETRSSGVDLPDGIQESAKVLLMQSGNLVKKQEILFRQKLTEQSKNHCQQWRNTAGGCQKMKKVLGVIELQDIIKPGIRNVLNGLRKMGVKTVMVTGDNPLTAKYHC